MDDHLRRLAELIKRRNDVEIEITALIDRPAQLGHLGEYIASQIFAIALQQSAVAKGIDGCFTKGVLAGRSVNIKWYGKQEGVLDITPGSLPDYYLVLTGPKGAAVSSRGKTRPWLIRFVYLFDAPALVNTLSFYNLRIGIAASVRQQLWKEAEIYPLQRNPQLLLSEYQRMLLALFG